MVYRWWRLHSSWEFGSVARVVQWESARWLSFISVQLYSKHATGHNFWGYWWIEMYLLQPWKEDEIFARLSDVPIAKLLFVHKAYIYGGLRFKEICTAEDALFALQLTFKASVSATTDVAFYYYLQHPNSFIHKTYTRKAFEDYVVYIKSVMDMRGERGGLGDGYLAFSIYRSSLPFLYRKIGDLANDKDRNWAWQECCLLVDRLEYDFGEHTVYYVKWNYRTHSRLLSWFFFEFRYWLRNQIVSNKTVLRLYQKIRGIRKQWKRFA